MTTDTERLDWVERELVRCGEVYEDEECTKLKGITRAWVIATMSDATLRESIDLLMQGLVCPGCGGEHGPEVRH